MVDFEDNTWNDETVSTTEKKNVSKLIDNSRHDSVNRKKLTRTKGGLATRYLYENPAIDYLKDGEQPHFIFIARRKTPDIDGEEFDTIQRNETGSVLHVVTDQRWLCIAGHSSGNQTLSVPLTQIENVDFNTGRLGHKVFLDTSDSHLEMPISNDQDEADIKSLFTYLRRNVVSSKQKQDKKSEAQHKIRNSKDNTITAAYISNSGSGLPNKAIIEYLNEEENIFYIFTDENSRKGIGINSKFASIKPTDGNDSHYVFTNQRILSIFPRDNEDKVLEFEYDSMDLIDFKISNRKDRNRLVIESNGKKIHFWMSQRTSIQKDALRHIYPKTLDNCKFVLIDPIKDANATLKILDRDTGMATMKTKGWNYGLGLVDRHKSKSKIEKQGYEETINELAILGDEIYMVTEGQKKVHRRFVDMGAIDEFDNGFTFFSSTGIYRIEFDFHPYHVTGDELSSGIDYIRNKIESISGADTQSDQNQSDNISKLERLSELKEQGILSEKEFDQKKSDLLDKI
jgi:hypothetical protein